MRSMLDCRQGDGADEQGLAAEILAARYRSQLGSGSVGAGGGCTDAGMRLTHLLKVRSQLTDNPLVKVLRQPARASRAP